MTIAIVDLGCGNVGSVRMALERLGAHAILTKDAEVIGSADKVILPGVGAARFAMERLNALDLAGTLRSLNQPALGICLGMHLLFNRSEEGDCECLGIIPGTVRKLEAREGQRVPHMGWSKLKMLDPGFGLDSGDYVYFAHSYACDPGPSTIARASHARPIAAAVRHGNWTGVQFHPERSGEAGARMLRSFLK